MQWATKKIRKKAKRDNNRNKKKYDRERIKDRDRQRRNYDRENRVGWKKIKDSGSICRQRENSAESEALGKESNKLTMAEGDFNARTGRKDEKGEEREKLGEQEKGRTRQSKDENMNKEGKSL